MESVGDTILHLSKVMDIYRQHKNVFINSQEEAISQMFALLSDAFAEMSINIEKDFNHVDVSKALEIEEQINHKRNDLRKQHVDDLKEKKYKHKIGSIYTDMFSICERIGDYIINVSEAIQEYQETD